MEGMHSITRVPTMEMATKIEKLEKALERLSKEVESLKSVLRLVIEVMDRFEDKVDSSLMEVSKSLEMICKLLHTLADEREGEPTPSTRASTRSLSYIT